MKTITRFYETLWKFLEYKPRDGENWAREAMFAYAKCQKVVTWSPSLQILRFMWDCLENGVPKKSEVLDQWIRERQQLGIAAFRDLSSLRDPEGMSVFRKLEKTLNRGLPTIPDMIWARKIDRRVDGSAVLILHVKDVELFIKNIGKRSHIGTLGAGMTFNDWKR